MEPSQRGPKSLSHHPEDRKGRKSREETEDGEDQDMVQYAIGACTVEHKPEIQKTETVRNLSSDKVVDRCIGGCRLGCNRPYIHYLLRKDNLYLQCRQFLCNSAMGNGMRRWPINIGLALANENVYSILYMKFVHFVIMAYQSCM